MKEEWKKLLQDILKEMLKLFLHDWFIELVERVMEWIRANLRLLLSLLQDLLKEFLRGIIRPWVEELDAEYNFVSCLHEGRRTGLAGLFQTAKRRKAEGRE